MGDRQARPQHGAMAPIEPHQSFWRPFPEPLLDARANPAANRPSAQALALEIQKGELVERVGGPQRRIELQSVDHLHVRALQEDVLGPKIAMAVDDPSPAYAIDQKSGVRPQGSPQYGVDATQEAGRQADLGIG